MRGLRYLPFAGVVAAAVVLWLMEPERLSGLSIRWDYLAWACVFLYVTLLGRAVVWWRFLRRIGVDVGCGQAIGAVCVSVLTKYIPGKVWPVLSIAARTSGGTAALGASILHVAWYQVCVICSGLAVGGGAWFALSGPAVLGFGVSVGGLLVVGLAMSRSVVVARVVRPIVMRAGVDIGWTGIPSVKLLFEHAGLWVVMALGFWLLFAAAAQEVPLVVALVQPLANTAGMLVPFMPAGLGVREAVGAAYLGQHLSDIGLGVVLATLARVWFFAVELLIFATGLWLCRDAGDEG